MCTSNGMVKSYRSWTSYFSKIKHPVSQLLQISVIVSK